MKSAHAIILVLAALCGCVPLKQPYVTGGHPYDHFGYVDHLRCGLLGIGPSNLPKSIEILVEESYAIAPGGTHYGISTEPHEYDLRPNKDPRVPYVRDRIYLVNAKGNRVNREWEDGKWKFHFVMATPTGRDARDFELTLGTFHYNPIIHGQPN